MDTDEHGSEVRLPGGSSLVVQRAIEQLECCRRQPLMYIWRFDETGIHNFLSGFTIGP